MSDYSSGFVAFVLAKSVITGSASGITDSNWVPKKLYRLHYPDANASGIKKALYYFGGFGANDAATQSLYAFRNALVHNASLLNERNGVYYSFRYDSAVHSVVVPAAQPWDGKMASLNDNTTTIVNPGQLVELVTAMVGRLNDYLAAGILQTGLSASDIVSNYLLLSKK